MGCGLIKNSLKIKGQISNKNQSNFSSIRNKSSIENKSKTITIAGKNLPHEYFFSKKPYQNDIFMDYQIHEKLDSNSHSSFFKIIHKNTGILYHMKMMRKDLNFSPNEDYRKIIDDIYNFMKLEHPNIAKILDFYEDKKYLYIILENIPGKSLAVKISEGKISTEEACSIMFQLLVTLNYIHSNNINFINPNPKNIIVNPNCDFEEIEIAKHFFMQDNISPFEVEAYKDKIYNSEIKGSFMNLNCLNLFVENDNPTDKPNHMNSMLGKWKTENSKKSQTKNIHQQENFIKDYYNINKSGEIKIFGFQLGNKIEYLFKTNDNNNNYNKEFEYLAPEIIKTSFNAKSDVWSCGVIFFQLLTGDLPFKGNTLKDLIANITSGEMDFNTECAWMGISPDIKSLITSMLTINPKQRISLTEAINDIIFKKYSKDILITNNMKNIGISLNNIRKNCLREKLIQITLNLMINLCQNTKAIYELKNTFNSFDINKDGKICFNELKNGMELIFSEKLSNDELKIMMNVIDANKTGFIEYEEFLIAFVDKKELMNDEKLRLVFDKIDFNKDAKISREEILKIYNEFQKEKFIKYEENTNNQNNNNFVEVSLNDNIYNKLYDYDEFKNDFIEYLNYEHMSFIDKTNKKENFKINTKINTNGILTSRSIKANNSNDNSNILLINNNENHNKEKENSFNNNIKDYTINTNNNNKEINQRENINVQKRKIGGVDRFKILKVPFSPLNKKGVNYFNYEAKTPINNSRKIQNELSLFNENRNLGNGEGNSKNNKENNKNKSCDNYSRTPQGNSEGIKTRILSNNDKSNNTQIFNFHNLSKNYKNKNNDQDDPFPKNDNEEKKNNLNQNSKKYIDEESIVISLNSKNHNSKEKNKNKDSKFFKKIKMDKKQLNLLDNFS